MDKYEHRRLRTLELMEWQCGGKRAELANRIERTSSYVSRMLSEPDASGHKRIADDLIEAIENAFSLPRGWLDAPLGVMTTVPPSPPTPLVSEVHVPYFDWPFELPRALFNELPEVERARIDGFMQGTHAAWASTAQKKGNGTHG